MNTNFSRGHPYKIVPEHRTTVICATCLLLRTASVAEFLERILFAISINTIRQPIPTTAGCQKGKTTIAGHHEQ